MDLKHFTLFAKGHYKWPRNNKDHDNNMWEYVKKALEADDYMPGNRGDIISILMTNTTKHIDKSKDDLVFDLVSAISPNSCYSIGYFTKNHWLAIGYQKRVKYDYQTAILYYFISKARFMTVDKFISLPKADPNVLPLNEFTETNKKYKVK